MLFILAAWLLLMAGFLALLAGSTRRETAELEALGLDGTLPREARLTPPAPSPRKKDRARLAAAH
jgi:hypothetical protein